MNAPKSCKKWGTLWREGVANYQTIDEIYSRRALYALSLILQIVKEIEDESLRDFALFSFSASLLNCSLLYRHRKIGGGSPTNLSQPQIFREMNVLNAWKRKIDDLVHSQYSKFMNSKDNDFLQRHIRVLTNQTRAT